MTSQKMSDKMTSPKMSDKMTSQKNASGGALHGVSGVLKGVFLPLLIMGVFVACATHTRALPRNAKYAIASISLNETFLPAPKSASFNIDNERIYGNAGCNNYFTDFAWVDDNIVEIGGGGGATKMMCAESENEFERMFLHNLRGKFNVTSAKNSVVLDNGSFSITLEK